MTVSVRALRGTVGTAGLPVRLEMLDGSTWREIRSGTSGAEGLVSWRLLPDRTRTFRAVVERATSGQSTVQVRQRVTASPARSRANAVVTGTTGPVGGSTVLLERQTATGWAVLARGAAAADGRYRLVAPAPRGSVLRVSVAARPGWLGASTGGVRLP